MARDLRAWIDTLEKEGELKRIKTRVNWDGEIAEIRRQVMVNRGPATLFENIQDHESTWCSKLLAGDLAKTSRIALMLGLPRSTPRTEVLKLLRKRLKEPFTPVNVATGPVKENIIKGSDIDLFQLPVPKWHPLDGGRYINTWCGVVTRDPEDGSHNVGLYRGMILGRDKIGVLFIPAKGWGVHYDKYRAMGKPMPVAVVYGWDPAMVFTAAIPLTSVSEYEAMGAIRQEPVPLCKCETSDLLVPSSAEIVIEGSMSTDPSSYEMEGPYGEVFGYYGERRERPLIKVDCITYRNDPVYTGALTGISKPGVVVSDDGAAMSMGLAGIMWNALEMQGISGVLDVVPTPVTAVKIHKTYQGQARHVAAALWGTRLGMNSAKIVVVVEEDVNINNPAELFRAMLLHVDPVRNVIVFPMELGELDPAYSSQAIDELKYGAALQNKMVIDATVDWVTHPVNKEWGDRRLPPVCNEPLPEMVNFVQKRWEDYGF